MSISPDVSPLPWYAFTRRNVIRWTIILLVIGILTYFAYHKGSEFWEELKKQWSQTNLSINEFGYGWFITGLIVFFVSVLSTFIRWRILLHALHIECSYLNAIRLGFVSYVGSMLLPGSTMGDAFKAGFIMKENPGNRLGALASIVVDRFIGLYSLFLLSACVGLFNLNTIWSYEGSGADELRVAYYVIASVACGGIIFYLLFIFLPLQGKGYRARIHHIKYIGKFLSTLLGAFAQYRRYPWAMVQAVMVGMAGHVGFVLSYYFASRALPGPGPTPDWQMHFIIIPFFMVFQAVPISFGGNLGVGDLVLGGLYQIVGAMQMKGLLASLIQRLITWIVALIGLIWYIPLQRKFQTLKAEPAVSASE